MSLSTPAIIIATAAVTAVVAASGARCYGACATAVTGATAVATCRCVRTATVTA